MTPIVAIGAGVVALGVGVAVAGPALVLPMSIAWGVGIATGVVPLLLHRRRDAARVTESEAREARLQRAQSLAHLGSWEWDANTGAVAWSDQQYRLVGYEPGTCVPSMAMYLDAVVPDDRAELQAHLGRALQGCAFDCEHRLVTPAGNTRVVHARGSVLTDAQGRVTQVLGIAQDITDRHIEKAMASEREAANTTRAVPVPRPHTSPNPSMLRPPRARVLVVEDDLITRRLTLHQLSTLGYRADGVDDGAAAVEAVQADSYDAVLMDCQMPGVDGFEATRRIRALDGRVALVPIVALTAQARNGIRDRCFASGMDDYLRKPVSADALDEVLTRWLAPRGPRLVAVTRSDSAHVTRG